MHPEAPRGLLEAQVGGPTLQRRHRVSALARRFERVAARLDLAPDVAGRAGDPELPLAAVVAMLEVVVADRPIHDRPVVGQRVLAEALADGARHAEVRLTEAPGDARPVDRATTGAGRWRQVERVVATEAAVRPGQDHGVLAVAAAPRDRVRVHEGQQVAAD